MPKISQVVKCSQKVTVGSGRDALHLTFDPSRYTPKFERELKRLAGDDGDRDGLSAMLAGLGLSWDLTDDEGAPIGTDEASLSALPIALLKECIDGIVAELLPNAPKNAPSGSFS